jgi:hypothetical protein
MHRRRHSFTARHAVVATARPLQAPSTVGDAVFLLTAHLLRSAVGLGVFTAARIDAFKVDEHALGLVDARPGLTTTPFFIFTEPSRHEADPLGVGLRHLATAAVAAARICFPRRSSNEPKRHGRIAGPNRWSLSHRTELPSATFCNQELSKLIGR